MDQKTILKVMESVGAVITDSHIVYTKGGHGSAYVNKDALYADTDIVSGLCKLIAEQFRNDAVEVVVGPAIGGVVLSQWVAHHLTKITGRKTLSVYAEKATEPCRPGKLEIKRGYDKIVAGKNVLVVEDILNTGGSAAEAIKAAREAGGEVIGLGALCNRGGVAGLELAGGIPKFFSLVDVTLDNYDPADCPLCRKGIPINTSVGKGKEFLANQPNYHEVNR